MKIITVLKSGGEYKPEMVRTISSMCRRHISIPHEFLCLSDKPIYGISTIRFNYDWPKWYAKMEAFTVQGPTLYLDLDTIILDNIDTLITSALEHKFVILRDFYRQKRNRKAMGSGLMFWNGDFSHLTKMYAANPITDKGGDQVVLEKFFEQLKFQPSYWQDITDCVGSFKVDVLKNGVGKKKLICFHGKPRPWEQRIIPYK